MFDPTEHPGLSEEAAALEPAALAAQARLAERLLRVDSLVYDSLSETEQEAWADMVLLQIDHQMQASPALTSERIGDVQRSFRAAGPISPDARLIRDAFFAATSSSWTLSGIYEARP